VRKKKLWGGKDIPKTRVERGGRFGFFKEADHLTGEQRIRRKGAAIQRKKNPQKKTGELIFGYGKLGPHKPVPRDQEPDLPGGGLGKWGEVSLSRGKNYQS